jgi:hypothetical protein
MMPPASATQSIASAGAALSGSSAKANSRRPIQPPRRLAFSVLLEVIYALVPKTSFASRAGPRQP